MNCRLNWFSLQVTMPMCLCVCLYHFKCYILHDQYTSDNIFYRICKIISEGADQRCPQPPNPWNIFGGVLLRDHSDHHRLKYFCEAHDWICPKYDWIFTNYEWISTTNDWICPKTSIFVLSITGFSLTFTGLVLYMTGLV